MVKFTMSDYFIKMDEIRERHKVKPASLIERARQVIQKKLPKLPKEE